MKKNYPDQLARSLVILLAPLFGLGVGDRCNATIPDIATVHDFGNNKPSVRHSRGTLPEEAMKNDILKSWLKESIIIPKGDSWAKLIFSRQNPQGSSQLVQLGPNNSRNSEYLFPCTASGGTGTIGWGLTRSDSGECGLLVIRGGTARISNFPRSLSRYIAQLHKVLPKGFSISQDASQTQYYCGALANSGEGEWGSAVDSSWQEACQNAVQECQASTQNGECSVATLGDWDVTDPSLMVSLACTQRIVLTNRNMISGSEVSEKLSDFERLYRPIHSKNCLPIVYGSDDVIVSPATNGLTLIQTKNTDGNIEVDVLVGSINLISAKRSAGLFLDKGAGYYNGDGRITGIECQSISRSSSMRNFLNPSSWLQNLTSQLEGYRKNFCQATAQTEMPQTSVPLNFNWRFPNPQHQERGRDRNRG
jgi:hypothetical protein